MLLLGLPLAIILGARLLDYGADRGWLTTAFESVGVLVLAILAYTVSELIGGNGFIAAFIAAWFLVMVFDTKAAFFWSTWKARDNY